MRPSFRRRPPAANRNQKWLLTFSDLITLILVFFILLFSMSQIDLVKFKALSQSFSQSPLPEQNSSLIPFDHQGGGKTDGEKGGKDHKKEDSLDGLLHDVQTYFKENDLGDIAVATRTERGVVLVLQEQVLFRTGDASILPSGRPFLRHVGMMLQKMPNVVKVEGHTDNRPIHTARYPSNWELSTARASSVIRHLIDSGNLDPGRFIAVGYGDARPLAPNDTPENLEKNRRVEIIISDPKYQEVPAR